MVARGDSVTAIFSLAKDCRYKLDLIIRHIMQPPELSNESANTPVPQATGQTSQPDSEPIQFGPKTEEETRRETALESIRSISIASRPPDLTHDGLLFHQKNEKWKPTFDFSLKATAVSHSGNFIGGFSEPISSLFPPWKTETHYSIHKIGESSTQLHLKGTWDQKSYRYTPAVGFPVNHRKDWPSSGDFFSSLGAISCAALSDKYIIVGTDRGRLLIFSLDNGNRKPGMLLCWAKQGNGIEKIVFSNDDASLLVLSHTGDRHTAVVYSPESEFRANSYSEATLIESPLPVEWDISVGAVVDAAFSDNGEMAAFCTCHDTGGYSYIRKIQFKDDQWVKAGQQRIKMFEQHRLDSSSPGIRNIVLYISLQSLADPSI